MYELLQRYISLKRGVRYNTRVGYQFVMGIVQKESFGSKRIRDVKVSDAQRWMIKLQEEGKGYSLQHLDQHSWCCETCIPDGLQ